MFQQNLWTLRRAFFNNVRSCEHHTVAATSAL
jgi:hypothetical protein